MKLKESVVLADRDETFQPAFSRMAKRLRTWPTATP